MLIIQVLDFFNANVAVNDYIPLATKKKLFLKQFREDMGEWNEIFE